MLNRKTQNIVKSKLFKIGSGPHNNRANTHTSNLIPSAFTPKYVHKLTTNEIKGQINEDTTSERISISENKIPKDAAEDSDKLSTDASSSENYFTNTTHRKITFTISQDVLPSDEIMPEPNSDLLITEDAKTNATQELHEALLEVNKILKDPYNKSFQRFHLSIKKVRNAIANGANPNYQLDTEHGKIFPLMVGILANQIEDFDFILKQGASLDLIDQDGSNIVHLASRFKGNIFILFYMTCLADSKAETRYLFSQKNLLSEPSDAMDFLFAGKLDDDVSREKLKRFIVLTFLSLDESNKLKSAAYPTYLASLSDKLLDSAIAKIAYSFYESFAVNTLMHKDHHLSREVFQIIRLIDISQEIEKKFNENFSFAEKRIIDEFIEIRLRNLDDLFKIEELTNDDFSLDHALFSCYDYLSFNEENNRYFSTIRNISKTLLTLGANANYTIIHAGSDRNLPLIFLSSHLFDYDFLLADLIDNKANLKLRFNNQDILLFNCRNKNLKSVKTLLEKEPEIFGLSENSGAISLLSALEAKEYNLARLLIEHSNQQNLPKNKINFRHKISQDFDLVDLIISTINQGKVAPDFFTFDGLQERILEIENNKEDERRKTVKELVQSLGKSKNPDKITRLISWAKPEELLVFQVSEKKSILEIIAEFGSWEDNEKTLSKINSLHIEKDTVEKIIDCAFRNKNTQVLKLVLQQNFCTFETLANQLKVFSIKGDHQNASKILSDVNFIEKYQITDRKEAEKLISEIRLENHSSNRDKIKKLLNDFEITTKKTNEKPLKVDVSDTKKLSKNALKKLKAEERAEKERIDTEEKKQKHEIKLTRINHQKLLDEFNGSIAVQRNAINEFLSNEREFSSIYDLPKFTQTILNSFLDENFRVLLKGSSIQQRSCGKKFTRPNDLDIEVIKSGISQMNEREILCLICEKFRIDISSFPPAFDSEMICKNQQGDEIKIFKNANTRNFTVNFSSKSRLIDLSIYDSDLPPNPNLSWNTSIDAVRLEILPNRKIQKTFVDNFQEYRRHFFSSDCDSDNFFIINPNSHGLILRLAFFVESGLVEMEEVQNAISTFRIRVLESLKKELKFDERNRENFSFHQCQAKINDFCLKHHLDQERKKHFISIIQTLTNTELDNNSSDKFTRIISNLGGQSNLKNPAVAAYETSNSNQEPTSLAAPTIKPTDFSKLTLERKNFGMALNK